MKKDTQRENPETQGKPAKPRLAAKWIALIVCAALVLGGAAAAGVLLSRRAVVTFDSAGGSPVEQMVLKKGDALVAPQPQKSGYTFAGWVYTDTNEPYNEGDAVTGRTELRAEYVKDALVDYGVNALGYVEPDSEFVLGSDIPLTEDNLFDYVEFADMGGSGTVLTVKGGDGVYTIRAKDGFVEGFTYKLTSRDRERVRFITVAGHDASASSACSYSFEIKKEQVVNAVPRAPIEHTAAMCVRGIVDAGTVAPGSTGDDIDDDKPIYGYYIENFDSAHKVGDIISIGHGGAEDDDTQYFKIISLTRNVSFEGTQTTYAELVTPSLSEVYEDFEVYVETPADLSELAENTEEIETMLAQQAEDERGGYRQLQTIVALSIKRSPSIQQVVSTLSAEQQARFYALTREQIFLSSPSVRFKVARGSRGSEAQLTISSGKVTVELGGGFELSLHIGVEEKIRVLAFSYMRDFGRKKTYENTGAYVTNDVRFIVEAGIAFAGKDDEEESLVDISDELDNLIETSQDLAQDYADELNNSGYFTDSLDYSDLAKVNLGSVTINAAGIISIRIKLEAFLSFGCRAELGIDLQYVTKHKLGVSNGELVVRNGRVADVNMHSKGKMRGYRELVYSSLRYDINMRGQIGLRGGVRVSVDISVLHLNDAYCVGLSAELGIYLELSGYVNVSGENLTVYGDYSSRQKITGGIYLEAGVYVSVDFYWKCWPFEGSNNLALWKFPLFYIGSKTAFVGFVKQSEHITVTTDSYNLLQEGHLALGSVNMYGPSVGGRRTAIVIPQTGNPDAYFITMTRTMDQPRNPDNRYVRIKDGCVYLSEDAPSRVEATVQIVYKDAAGGFRTSDDPLGIFMDYSGWIYKNVTLLFADFEGDPNRTYTVTYHGFDGEIVRTDTYYVGQRYVSPPFEEIMRDPTSWYKYTVDTDNMWLLADGTPLTETEAFSNVDLYLQYSPIMYDVEYYAYVPDSEGSLHGSYVGTRQVRFGEDIEATHPALADFGVNLPSYVGFNGWEPIPGFEGGIISTGDENWQYTLRYTALCPDTRPVIYFNFGTGGFERVLTELGSLPVPPSAQEVFREGYEFVKWYPEIVPAQAQGATYTAVYERDTLIVKFLGADGELLSQQVVRRGELPTPPEIGATALTDYMRLVFTGWSPAVSPASGAAYEIYTAQFQIETTPVTVSFDSKGHGLVGGAPSVYTGEYVPGAQNNATFKPPAIAPFSDGEFDYELAFWRAAGSVRDLSNYQVTPQYKLYYTENITYEPVFKKTRATYSVTFQGGGQLLRLSGGFGDVITEDMLRGTFKDELGAETSNLVTSWGVRLPYTFGTAKDDAGQPLREFNCVVVWSSVPTEHTVTFDANGGSFAGGRTAVTVTGGYLETIPVPAAPSKPGHDFKGWATSADSAQYASLAGTPFTETVVYYAVYAPKQITLTFNANGGSLGGDDARTVTGDFGTAVSFSDVPTRSGHEFAGWSASAGALTGSPASSIRFSANATYYAVWREVGMVYVTFDAGAGAYLYQGWFIDGDYSWKQTLTVKVTRGGVIDLNDHGGATQPDLYDVLKPRKPGTGTTLYTFSGWNSAFVSGVTTFDADVTYTAVYTSAVKSYTASVADHFLMVGASGAVDMSQTNDAAMRGAVLTSPSASASGGFSSRITLGVADDGATLELDGQTLRSQGYYITCYFGDDITAADVAKLKSKYGWTFTEYYISENALYIKYAANALTFGVGVAGSFDFAANDLRFYTSYQGDLTFNMEFAVNEIALVPVFRAGT